jgi:hypothetical protein
MKSQLLFQKEKQLLDMELNLILQVENLKPLPHQLIP